MRRKSKEPRKQNISTLVVTEVLHEVIDSIFKNSTETTSFIQNSKKIFKEEDEIRRKSKKSRKESRKRKHKNFEHDHKSYKHRKKDEKSRNEIVNQFFPDPKDEDNKICVSIIEQKLDDKINCKINFNISTLVVTEVLHEMINSIFKNSTETLSCIKNSKKISGGEIDSDSECSIIFETKKVTAPDDDHTCNQGLICPKCIHFTFQGSKKNGPGYHRSHKYSNEFKLELSTDIFHLLKKKKINLKLLPVKTSSSFKILEKFTKLKIGIGAENSRVQVKFHSRHKPE